MEPTGWQDYDTVFTNAKAGMEHVDPDHVKKVVYEMSKGSPHFENEQRKMAVTNDRIQRMIQVRDKLSQFERKRLQKVADSILANLEMERILSKTWFHVDMDSFFFAVEALDDPSLHGRPVAVGGRSMISTANYEARKYGVRSAMPPFIALRLCPQLHFVGLNFEKYSAASRRVTEVLKKYDPELEMMSLDEAYLDVTPFLREHSLSSSELANRLRQEVRDTTGLTCSVGVAPNKRLAKVCSDINKPNGQYILANDTFAIRRFVETLPVRKVSGIGKVTERILKEAVGALVCGDLIQNRDLILGLFSQSSAEFLLAVGLGIGATEHSESEEGKVGRRGLSCERTFKETADKQFLLEKCTQMVHHLVQDLEKEGLKGKTITLKMKTAGFVVKSRSVTLQHFTCSETIISQEVQRLLSQELPIRLRLLGVRMSNFEEMPSLPRGQTSLDTLFSCPGEGPDGRTLEVDKFTIPNIMWSGPGPISYAWSKSGWSCSVCTLFNGEEETRACAVCGKSRGNTEVGCYWCNVCDVLVTEDCAGEHNDYHIARQIEREERLLSGLAPVPKKGRQATLKDIYTNS